MSREATVQCTLQCMCNTCVFEPCCALVQSILPTSLRVTILILCLWDDSRSTSEMHLESMGEEITCIHEVFIMLLTQTMYTETMDIFYGIYCEFAVCETNRWITCHGFMTINLDSAWFISIHQPHTFSYMEYIFKRHTSIFKKHVNIIIEKLMGFFYKIDPQWVWSRRL